MNPLLAALSTGIPHHEPGMMAMNPETNFMIDPVLTLDHDNRQPPPTQPPPITSPPSRNTTPTSSSSSNHPRGASQPLSANEAPVSPEPTTNKRTRSQQSPPAKGVVKKRKTTTTAISRQNKRKRLREGVDTSNCVMDSIPGDPYRDFGDDMVMQSSLPPEDDAKTSGGVSAGTMVGFPEHRFS